MANVTNILTAPTALRLVDAARHCSMSEPYFNRMVNQGLLPSARLIGSQKRWLRQELDQSLFALPQVDEGGDNPCDRLLG